MQKENNNSALKKDFLAAYQSILFSKKNDDDVDVERRCLAVKYLTASQHESQDAAALLLGQGLRKYQTLSDRTGLINNIDAPDNKERTEWKSNLNDVKQALDFVMPLPCQKNNSDKVCGRRDLVDRDVENLMTLPKNCNEEQPVRKLASGLQMSRFAPECSKKLDSQNRFPNSRSEQLEIKQNTRLLKRQRMEEKEEDDRARKDEQAQKTLFRTAKTELHVQQQQQQNKANKKSLGGKASVNSKFVCPLKRERDREEEEKTAGNSQPEVEDERLRGIDEKLIELVRNEIMDNGTTVTWNDVAGLEHAKKIIKEIVVLPMLRPDIFTGLRRPPKGILLFGPPGTGKTLIGKCIASQSKSTFFSISASSLTSKWIGESEKMVRALFAVARVHQPSVIFIDEIDSLLTQRSETEHESSRRIKTEFLVQLDGAATGEEDRILVIGATNRPQELDEAARRRFVKRLYVPLPELEARRQIVENLLAAERHELTAQDINNIAKLSEHYSGADMTSLCKEASMGPIRSIPFDLLENIRKEDVRCVTAEDFQQALTYVRPSVSQADLGLYVKWDSTYGSGTASLGKSN